MSRNYEAVLLFYEQLPSVLTNKRLSSTHVMNWSDDFEITGNMTHLGTLDHEVRSPFGRI